MTQRHTFAHHARRHAYALGLLLLAATTPAALAQGADYPTKAVTLGKH